MSDATKLNKPRRFRRLIFGRALIIFLALALQFFLLFSAMISLFEYIPTLVGGTAVFTAIMLGFILNTRQNPSIKLTWCILIAIFPLFGTVLYFFTRADLGHRLEQRHLQSIIDKSKELIPEFPVRSQEIRQKDPSFYPLTNYLTANGFPAYSNTDVRYFPLGEDCFQEMLIQLEQAESFIFLEYFSISPGHMWDSILEVLCRKARQGVEVKLLYDGGCAVSDLPHNYPKHLERRGIQCKVFSPFRPLVSTHYNNRDHRKIMVIDGTVAFTGGINLLDCYINKTHPFGHWKDTAVMLQGEGARGFTLMFLQMWNALDPQGTYDPYLAPVSDEDGARGYVIPYCDNPMDQENLGEMVYLNILNQAKDYVYIMTPYLILDNEMLTALCFAAKRGVDVRLILPHIPDKRYAFALAKSHYQELMDAGVKIYEYTPGFVHAKVFLSDDAHAVVGTINLDYRSLYLHFECAAYLYRTDAISDIHQDFQNTLALSQQITPEAVKKPGFFSRLVGAVLKIVAPLM